MSDALATIEKLTSENSRLHKEIQRLQKMDDAAYTPYRDASYALEMLRQLGCGAKNPDTTLAEMVHEIGSIMTEWKRNIETYKQTLDGYEARENAIINISVGQDVDERYKRYPSISQVAKLRATLEMIKLRLERLEKFNYNDEINQLHFDLVKFLMPPERV